MYGWKKTDSAASASSRRPPADLLEDGEEEEVDAFAPLPSELSSAAGGKQFSKSAKDKRRLREKRRSTGVARLDDHQSLRSDELTTRNTSYNETPGVIDSDGVPSTRIGSTISSTTTAAVNDDGDRRNVTTNDGGEQRKLPSHAWTPDQTAAHHRNQKTSAAEEIAIERLRHQVDSEKFSNPSSSSSSSSSSYSSSSSANPDFPKNLLCARPFAAQRSILKTNSRPIISPKPEMVAVPSSAPSLSVFGQRSSEEFRLMSRISELEESLESEKKEKAKLEKSLSARDLRIRELESQIATLNEDLDLADEDYLRLEEENHALARALSQLNVV